MFCYIKKAQNRHVIQHSNSKLVYECKIWASVFANGHITLSTPVLVRSPKLSSVELSQYLDGWPPGNTECCWHPLFWFCFCCCLFEKVFATTTNQVTWLASKWINSKWNEMCQCKLSSFCFNSIMNNNSNFDEKPAKRIVLKYLLWSYFT